MIISYNDDALNEILDSIENMESGLVLASGATGSGKTTMLGSMAHYFKTQRGRKVLGVQTEDKGEEFIAGIKYVSFPAFEPFAQLLSGTAEEKSVDEIRQSEYVYSRLRMILREEPEVIIMDDLQSQSLALMAIILAETNSLVIASNHASSSLEAIERIDSFLAGGKNYHISNLVNTIRLSINQKLVFDETLPGRVPVREKLVADAKLRNGIRNWEVKNSYLAFN